MMKLLEPHMEKNRNNQKKDQLDTILYPADLFLFIFRFNILRSEYKTNNIF